MTNADKWRDIKGYEGLYQVSNHGKIKSLERYKKNHSKLKKVNEKILKTATNRYGYCIVVLSKNGISHTYTVHKLVMESFNRSPYENEVINHIDSNKTNNNIENLEYVTQKENIRKAWENGLCENVRKNAMNMVHKNAIPPRAVAQKDLNGNLIATYVSIREAERKTGITSGEIAQVCKGRYKKTHNFVFTYLESEEVV